MVHVVDFFSGCGGTSQGLKNAGFEILAAIDNDPIAADSYKQNFPEAVVFNSDVRDVTVTDLNAILPEGPVLFAGCAPCQPFSKQNRGQRADDPRRGLLAAFQNHVELFLPEYVLVENVPGIQKVQNTAILDRFIRSLRRRGYDIDIRVVSALDFGVAQTRRRLVLVASRVGEARIPEKAAGVTRPRTVRDEISDMPHLEAGQKDPSDPHHVAMNLSPLNLRRLRSTPEGGTRASWPKDMLLDCHKQYSGHSDVYGRLSWDKPATAMTTRCISLSNGRFGHPTQDRAISLREAALLQSFPRSFHFTGTLAERARQVGNAVPPRMAEALGRSLVGGERPSE